MKHSVDVLTNARPVMDLQDEYPAGFIDPMHSHDHIKILYASAGVMSVRTPETSFVLPPHRALWLPSGTRHAVAGRCQAQTRTLSLTCAGQEHERTCRVLA